jgi:hypothetical protein
MRGLPSQLAGTITAFNEKAGVNPEARTFMKLVGSQIPALREVGSAAVEPIIVKGLEPEAKRSAKLVKSVTRFPGHSI